MDQRSQGIGGLLDQHFVKGSGFLVCYKDSRYEESVPRTDFSKVFVFKVLLYVENYVNLFRILPNDNKYISYTKLLNFELGKSKQDQLTYSINFSECLY